MYYDFFSKNAWDIFFWNLLQRACKDLKEGQFFEFFDT